MPVALATTTMIDAEAQGPTGRRALSCLALERRLAECEAVLANERSAHAATRAELEGALATERSAHAATRAELEAARGAMRTREAAYTRLETQHTDLADTHARVVQERDQLLKRFLGRKSEKDRTGSAQPGLSSGQAEGAKGDNTAATNADPAKPSAAAEQITAALGGASTPSPNDADAAPQKKPRGKGGRKKLSALLERRREVILPPEHLRICACGQCKVQIGEETSEKLERVPATYYVRVTVRPTLACPDACESSVVCAPAPLSRITHGLAAESVHALVLTSKFGDHLPLNRISEILQRDSVLIPTSTLGHWVKRDAFDLSPIYRAMCEEVLASPIVRTDDTSIRVLDAKAEGGVRSGRIWAYLGLKRGDIFFTYSATKENADEEGCHAVLAGFVGTVQADASNGYDALFRDGTRCEAGCWCHCRRKFVDALEAFPKEARHARDLIRALYAIERKAKLDGLDAAARQVLRQEKSKPIVDAFFEWVKLASARAVPKTLLATALGYAKNQEHALRAFLNDGRLEADNNDTERALRQIAVGRRAWLFAGNDAAARNTSVVVTLVYACKELGINPVAYLTDILTRVSTHPASRVRELTPRGWLEARKQAAAVVAPTS